MSQFSASGPLALDAYLRQEATFEEVRAQLESDLKHGASPSDWTARLDELAAQSLLPEELVSVLRRIIVRHLEADRTLLKPQTGPADAGPPASSPDDASAIRSDDVSEIRRAERSGTPTLTGGDSESWSGLPIRPATGSDWSRPDQWAGADVGPIGPGTVIKERYVLKSVIGEGGMGVVYRALDRIDEDARHRNPYVAIKILNEEFRKHSKAAIALHREARKSQSLSHPNIVHVRDFDRDGTIVFMTMELLEGDPLDKIIKESHLAGTEPGEAFAIIRDIAAALAHAHSMGIAHSDLKPGNVIRTKSGVTKVLDFGIARAVPSELRPNETKTVFDITELGAMTPGYASLDMRRGEAPEPVDDIYALGVIAYELLTGEHPYGRMPADQALAAGLKPPVIKWLPARQRRVLERAVSFDRDSRPANGGEFLAALDRRGPALKIATAGAFAVALSVAAYAFYSAEQPRPDVPWESLSPSEQAAFTSAIEDGRTLLGFGDGAALNEAFDRFSDAYDIHRNNPDAIAGLESVADRFLSIMGDEAEPDRLGVVRKLHCQEYLANYAPVTAACDAAFGEDQCRVGNMSCQSRGP